MNCNEMFESIKKEYSIVKILSNKNECKIFQMRHKTSNCDIVLRQYRSPVAVYNFLKNIRHDNLPQIYDTYMLEDGQIVLEEFISGITVAEVLESGKYTYRGARKIISSVCDALSFLHSINIIHRDIKPENIMITDKGTVKLIDLNASRVYKNKSRADTVVLGTIGYASPEQYGLSQSDSRADIYALGILLNVMLTGVHPSERLAKGRAGKIVLKCTQIDPNKRYQSVEELKYNL